MHYTISLPEYINWNMQKMKMRNHLSQPKQTLLTIIAVTVAAVHLGGSRGWHIIITNIAGHLRRGGCASIIGVLKRNTGLQEEPIPALLIEKLENPLHVPAVVDEERPGMVLPQP